MQVKRHKLDKLQLFGIEINDTKRRRNLYHKSPKQFSMNQLKFKFTTLTHAWRVNLALASRIRNVYQYY